MMFQPDSAKSPIAKGCVRCAEGVAGDKLASRSVSILFLSFRRVLNVNYSFLGNSPASEF